MTFGLFHVVVFNAFDTQRGAGYMFGAAVVKKFCHSNGFEHITRAHQLCMEGYQVLFDDQLSTVWSAPNYCYRCGNIASIMEVAENLDRNYNTFDASPDNERCKTEGTPEEPKDTPDYFVRVISLLILFRLLKVCRKRCDG